MKSIIFAVLTISTLLASPKFVSAQEITIFPDNPVVSNCYPFGNGGVLGSAWGPFLGFIYKDIPAFNLVPGDTLAFDLGQLNNTAVELDIELAATTVNGGDLPAQPFVKVVSNTHTPLNPNGDDIVGDFEMQFTVEAPFDFPGGGLIIRFSNPSASYALDSDCDQVLVNANQPDTSGFFVERYYQDADGLPPYSNTETGVIGAFRVIETSRFDNIPALSEWGMAAAAGGLMLVGVFFAVKRRRSNAV